MWEKSLIPCIIYTSIYIYIYHCLKKILLIKNEQIRRLSPLNEMCTCEWSDLLRTDSVWRPRTSSPSVAPRCSCNTCTRTARRMTPEPARLHRVPGTRSTAVGQRRWTRQWWTRASGSALTRSTHATGCPASLRCVSVDCWSWNVEAMSPLRLHEPIGLLKGRVSAH